MPIKITLRDTNLDVVRELGLSFADCPEVRVICGDLLGADTPWIATPGNSWGFMSGGLDLVIAAAFPGLEDAVQKSAPIEVGDTRIFSVQHPVIHAVVYAPTMAIAKDVSTSKNAFLAMYGVLCAAGVCEQDISIPGLCTGVGKMPPIVAAVQMRAAYLEWQHARS